MVCRHNGQNVKRLNDMLQAESLGRAAYYFRHSWAVSWPMILIMSFDFFINLTDVYIAGKIGKEVQASVGFVSQIYFIFIVIANALSIGTVAVVSRFFGAGSRHELEDSIKTVLASSAVLGLILGIAGITFSPYFMEALAIPVEIKKAGIPLVRIYAAGLVFHYILISTNAVLRSTKRISRSVMTMAVVCVLNISLNFYFVFHTPVGFTGIALSTVCSLAAGCLINLYFIKKIFTQRGYFSITFLKRIAAIGWPSGLLQVAWQIGSALLFVIVGMLPQRNIETLAALTNGLRIEAAIFMPAFALSQANAVITGNLLGESKEITAYRAGLSTAVIGVVIITLMTVLVVLNAQTLSAMLSANSLVIDESVRYLYISMVSEPLMAWAVIQGGGLNGAGDTRGVMKIVILSQWAVRIPLAYMLGIYFAFGAAAIWWSMNASIAVHAVLITRRYFRKKWLEHD